MPLAQQTLATAPALRAQLSALLVNPTASPVLPLAGSTDGIALLTKITQLQNTFGNQLGIPGLTGTPALPTLPLGADEFGELLTSPTGFGLAPPTQAEHFGLGDIEAGITADLGHHGSPGDAGWAGAWFTSSVRFPTGQRPDPTVLLDQGMGAGDPAMTVGGIVEVGRRRWGLRGEGDYQHQFALSEQTRLGATDQLLIPATFSASVTQTPGDVITLRAEPFYHLAPHLAITGLFEYWRKGASSTSYAAGQAAIPGADPAALDVGSAANAMLIGFGLSYAHDGLGRDGKQGLPVEAAVSIERTVASGAGLVPAPLTSRMTFRIYKALFKP